MLQPVMIAPSVRLEGGADFEMRVVGDRVLARGTGGMRRARQRRPMMPSSSAMNSARTRMRRLHDFVVVQGLWAAHPRPCSDARNPEHLHAHLSRDNGFGNGGHADGIGAERAKRADLGRCFIAWPVHGDVDAVLDRQADGAGGCFGDAAQAPRIDLGHVRKAEAKAVVVAARPAGCCQGS